MAARQRALESADGEATWREVRPALDAAVASLPGRYRDVVVLHYLAGRSGDEAAAELGLTGAAFRKRLSRAIERLRGWFARRGTMAGTGMLTVLLAERTLEQAPARLAETVAAAALGGSGAASAAVSIAEGALKMMMWAKVKVVAACVAVAVAVGGIGAPLAVRALAQDGPAEGRAAMTSEKWIYVSHNFDIDRNVDAMVEVVRRGAKAGYNGVLVTDCKFFRWNEVKRPAYDNRVKRFVKACRDGKMKVIAAVCAQGTDLLANDRNLAEGMPVVEAPFVARGGKLVPADDDLKLENPSFDLHRGDQPLSWNVDFPGAVSFIDTEVKCHGDASLRIQDIKPKSSYGNGRANQLVKVKPFRYYHMTVMVKTEGFEAPRTVNFMALGKQCLNHQHFEVAPTQDWKKLEIAFNTLDNEEVTIYMGSWGGGRGKIWFDDVRVEPGGMVNILRRDSLPLKVTSADGKTVYAEGRDFAEVKDPKMGMAKGISGIYDVWHEPPVVTVGAGSRIAEGEKVLASYNHSMVIYGYSTPACMCEPAIWPLTKWHLENVHKVLEPDAYMMCHDEIRQMGWDDSCRKTGKSMADVLAENVSRCAKMIKEEDPGKQIYVWSDMFDPNHNANDKGYYYLVRGKNPWYGGWKGLDKDMIIVNWYGGQMPTLKWFSDRGHKQILAGYYDAPGDNITPWLEMATKVKGVRGVMYTTWGYNYGELESFITKVEEFGRK